MTADHNCGFFDPTTSGSDPHIPDLRLSAALMCLQSSEETHRKLWLKLHDRFKTSDSTDLHLYLQRKVNSEKTTKASIGSIGAMY